jgi:hypothetical protein
MRHSRLPRHEVIETTSHQSLFAQVGTESTVGDRKGSLLFVGGNSHEDVAVRVAQSHVRLDRTPSYWSHVAIILDWPDGAAPRDVVGVEAALDPEAEARRVPERNGVTLFRLSRYMKAGRYPNLGLGMPVLRRREEKKKTRGVSKTSPSDTPRDALLKAVLNPGRDRARFPLWDWLGVWSLYAATLRDNPLDRHVSHPGAALCEYAYEAMGYDLTPGATAPDTCPETLWSTLLYWYETFGAEPRKSQVRIWTSLAKHDSLVREIEKSSLEDDYREATAGKIQS